MLSLVSKAKINLFLHVIGKRNDGYHLLESLVGFTDFGDILNFECAKENSLVIQGNFASSLYVEDINQNLILKVVNYFQKEFAITTALKITLIKNIPVGAGIGGGSSNCAITMLAINKIFKLNLSLEKLQEIAILFGADVPVCLQQQCSFFTGIGDKVQPMLLYSNDDKFQCFSSNLQSNFQNNCHIDFEIEALDKKSELQKNNQGLAIILVNPKQALSTKEVFKKYKTTEFTEALNLATINYSNIDDFYSFLNLQNNNLTLSASQYFLALNEILNTIKASGAGVVKMSGSGLTCFGLYKNKVQAQEALLYLQKKFKDKDYWLVNTVLK